MLTSPPRLGISIPSSPQVRPAGTPNPTEAPPARPLPPRLNPVAGSSSGPPAAQSRRPRITIALPVDSSASISSEVTDSSRNGSLADGGSVSSPAASSGSGHIVARDSASAVASSPSGGGGSPRAAPAGEEKQMSMDELLEHLDAIKVSLDGREPDVADLDDDGWRAVSKSGRIIDLGYLGEGAGGAVTRCILKGGNTVFALKVRSHQM
jgi:mitogen-activated protein kinase kinase